MLDWIAERIWAATAVLPGWFVAKDSPHFMLIRTMFGLLLIVFVIYVIAMRPFRSSITRCLGKACNLMKRKQ